MTTAGRVGRGCAEQERGAQEDGFGEHDVGGLRRQSRHDVSYWALAGRAKTCSTSNAIALTPFNLARSGKRSRVPVVEVRLGGQWHIRRTRGGDPVGEARAGDEPYVVAALDEVLGDRQQRRHMTVRRNAGDDDR